MTTAETTTGLMTADELLRLDGDGMRGELIRGVFCEVMSTGREHAVIAGRLVYYLNAVVIPGRLGEVATSDMGVLLERDPDTVREPDVAFTSAEKAPLDVRVTGYAEVVPDIVAEVQSPNDTRPQIRAKALMWLSHGVRLVWVVDPDTRTIDVYRPDAEPFTLSETATLDGGDVLPGFTCPVAAVFGP